MVVTIIRLALLCASLYGFMRLVSRHIAPELSIGFTFACIGSAMLLAGVLNALPQAALLICLGGLFCLGRELMRDRRLPMPSAGGWFFLGLCVMLAVRVWGCRLNHLDNFTHWGLVVKHMLATDRFPNFADGYIRYQSYPLGAGALIDYFVVISGIRAEWFQMLVHWACAAAMLSGLWCLAKDIPSKLMCAAGSLLILCADNNFDQLLVDSTLAFVALGAAAFCVYYGGELKQKGFYVIPWLTFLVTVKNSGALFALFVIFLVFLWGGWRKGLAALAAPAMCLLIWNRHVAYVFESGMTSQHSMSVDFFRRMLAGKRARSVRTIVTKLLREVLSPANPYLAVLAISVVVLALAAVWFRRARRTRLLLIYGASCYLIYQAGMAAMYVFTMSEKEALVLASYPRYHGTILIFCAGVLLMAVTRLTDDPAAMQGGRRWREACCAGCALAIAVSGIPDYTHYLKRYDADAATRLGYRDTLEGLIDAGGVPEGSRCYVLIDEGFPHLTLVYSITSYLLLSGDVEVRTPAQIIDVNALRDSDYLLAFGESDGVMDFVEQHFQTRERVVELDEVQWADADADAEKPLNLAEQMKQTQGGGSLNLAEQMKQTQGGGSLNLAEQMKQSKSEG